MRNRIGDILLCFFGIDADEKKTTVDPMIRMNTLLIFVLREENQGVVS